MTTPQAVTRTSVVVDGVRFDLAPGQDIAAIKADMELAVRGAAAFVDFALVDNRRVEALITPTSQIAFCTETFGPDAQRRAGEALEDVALTNLFGGTLDDF
ncbi:hypothetical protein N3K63_06125 [Microbacterium sp. W1N]|uniref:hypothetical protein n=1 Tax=Microbacterium festucae TaxID=2977531 RepID=UPI0021C191CD|nr:hypothetical protein [Microbacterium festucae]MCT9819863.1 hypothetical protein [Microbacterium festucae]